MLVEEGQDLLQPEGRAVGGAVVDEDHLEGAPEGHQHVMQLLRQRKDGILLVVRRNDDAEVRMGAR